MVWYGCAFSVTLTGTSLDVCFSFFNQNLAKVKASHTQVLEDMEKLNEELKKVCKGNIIEQNSILPSCNVFICNYQCSVILCIQFF